MYSRDSDSSICCAESSQDGEKSELHLEGLLLDRKMLDKTLRCLDLAVGDLCWYKTKGRE